jgi:hypothetical protein
LAPFLKNLSGERGYAMTETRESSFGGDTRRRLVQEFAISYYNGALKPNLAEKNPMTGRDIEFLMDAPQFEKIKRSEMWAFSTAVGSGYQYRVVYRDKRFSDLEPLMQMYSGAITPPEGDVSAVERRLYEVILVLMREGRVPKTFQIASPKEAREERAAAMLDEFGKSLDELGKRVKQLEDELRALKGPSDRGAAPPPLP